MSTEDILDLNRKIAAIEHQLRHLYEHLRLDPPPPPSPSSDVSPAVLAAAREGNLIEAIKLYREETGCNLAVAKERVERLVGSGLP